MIGGVDFSKYQAGVTVEAVAGALGAQGPVVTVQAVRNDGVNEHCGRQLATAKAAGCKDLSIYILPNYEIDKHGSLFVGDAVAVAAGGLDIRELLFVAVDVEPYPSMNRASLPWRMLRVMEILEATGRAGLHGIVYSNKGGWGAVMGGSPQDWGLVVNRSRLWVASLDHTPTISDEAAIASPWAGWAVVGEQYEVGSWGGFSMDQNVWLDEFINERRRERDARLAPPPPPPPAPPPAPVDVCAELRAKLDRVRQIVG